MRTEFIEDISELIDNEWYIVRYSGEIPEIAYNSAIYFLTRADDGPSVCLTEENLNLLKQAAVDRYEEIILRDLLHENVGTSAYRGVARSICNYHRFTQFCQRQDLSVETLRIMAGQAYLEFLHIESERLADRNYRSVINCSFPELSRFAQVLKIPFYPEASTLESFCPVNPE